MEELVSIVIPVFNTGNYLIKTLESIRNQKYCNYEVLLIDDGSTDGSQDICDYYSSLDDRFVAHHIHNQGYSFARNFGLSRVRGKYITFADSDDVLDDELLLTQIDCITKYNADISICREKLLYENYIKDSNVVHNNEIIVDNKQKNDLLFSLNKYKGSPYSGGQCWKKMIKREIIQGIQFVEDRSMCEDEIFTKDIFDKADKIVINSRSGYYYRMRVGSAVHENEFNFKILKGRIKLYDDGRINKELLVKSSLSLAFTLYKNRYKLITKEQLLLINILKKYTIDCLNLLHSKQKVMGVLFTIDWPKAKIKWNIMRVLVSILLSMKNNKMKYRLFD